jgi:hypothetical protein
MKTVARHGASLLSLSLSLSPPHPPSPPSSTSTFARSLSFSLSPFPTVCLSLPLHLSYCPPAPLSSPLPSISFDIYLPSHLPAYRLVDPMPAGNPAALGPKSHRSKDGPIGPTGPGSTPWSRHGVGRPSESVRPTRILQPIDRSTRMDQSSIVLQTLLWSVACRAASSASVDPSIEQHLSLDPSTYSPRPIHLTPPLSLVRTPIQSGNPNSCSWACSDTYTKNAAGLCEKVRKRLEGAREGSRTLEKAREGTRADRGRGGGGTSGRPRSRALETRDPSRGAPCCVAVEPFRGACGDPRAAAHSAPSGRGGGRKPGCQPPGGPACDVAAACAPPHAHTRAGARGRAPPRPRARAHAIPLRQQGKLHLPRQLGKCSSAPCGTCEPEPAPNTPPTKPRSPICPTPPPPPLRAR